MNATPPGPDPPNADSPDERSMTVAKRTELLMEHYRDTSSIVLRHWRSRDRFFLYVLLVIAMIGVNAFSPGALSTLINGYVKRHILEDNSAASTRHDIVAEGQITPEGNIKAEGHMEEKPLPQQDTDEWEGLDFSAIDLMVQFLLLCLLISYYQKSILVKRMFTYVNFQEAQLSRWMGEDARVPYVARDGAAYFSRTGDPTGKQSRPWFLLSVKPLYVWLSPLAMVFLAIYLSVPSLCVLQTVPWSLLGGKLCDLLGGQCDAAFFRPLTVAIGSTISCLGMIVYSLLYFIWETFSR